MPPKFAKPPPWLVTLFDELIAGTAGERRQMFGSPCGFLDGQLFSGVFGAQLFVRLSEEDRAKLLSEGAQLFDPMGGRPMKEYVVLPAALLDDERAVRRWMDSAVQYARALGPKKAKKKAAPKKAASKKR
jgi:TfoX/Sxy family transcriptional regulator of competence genes